MNSAPMIDKCFRHQHPEAYGDSEVPEPPVPVELRYGRDRLPAPSAGCVAQDCLAEEALGYPDARPLAD